uniref:Uncharacterized protein n=1 Tax=Ensifer adhaerens TaxID=106592 RepID=D1CSH2_ENSAD|nr:hypothetical protein [Ensifer adhaerens]
MEMSKAKSSGVSLTIEDAAIAKGMLSRGDRQHDVAAWFGVNGGRITDIHTGKTFGSVLPVFHGLPPPGPYHSPKKARDTRRMLEEAYKDLLEIVQKFEGRLSEL